MLFFYAKKQKMSECFFSHTPTFIVEPKKTNLKPASVALGHNNRLGFFQEKKRDFGRKKRMIKKI